MFQEIFRGWSAGLEPTTFWSLRHNRKFFIYFPNISKSFVSATDAFVCSYFHCFHVVQIRKWSNMWSFRLHVKNGCKNWKRTTHVRIHSFSSRKNFSQAVDFSWLQFVINSLFIDFQSSSNWRQLILPSLLRYNTSSKISQILCSLCKSCYAVNKEKGRCRKQVVSHIFFAEK